MAKKTSIEISTISLFPEFVQGYTQFGIIARAIEKKILKWQTVNLRDFGFDARKTVDDRPYGGGVGMVLRPDVLYSAIKSVIRLRATGKGTRVILLTPSGKRFTQKDAQRLAKCSQLVFVSGRYEGYDERITQFVDEELSIGDYVLMGGELPALVIAEAVLRNVPGVLGKDESAAQSNK
jgi:tRNA (guanine37-N1)-methyltransferase